MKKRFLVLILLLLIALALPLLVNAETKRGTCGSNLTWTLTDDGMLTISGTGAMSDYQTYYSKVDKKYHSYAPWGENVKQIVINDGVTTIGKNAFYKCDLVTKITIGRDLTNVTGLSSSQLVSYNVSSGNSHYRSIDGILFDKAGAALIRCPAKKDGEYIIPNGVTSIESSAFSGCRELTRITIPDSVTSIGGQAFFGCSQLESISISAGVTSIGTEAFSRCLSLKSITIPNGLTSIEYRTFNECYGLTSVTIPNSVTKIGENAFNSCHSLAKVTIPNSVTSIGQNAFNGCSSDLIVYCYTDSEAQAYAEENSIKYMLLYVKPTVTTQPVSKTVNAGETAAFTVQATGATGYQWYYRKTSSGAWNIVQNNGTSATYNLTTIASHNGYQFRCLVKNSAGSVYSDTVTLKVKPGITAQPTDKTVSVGETAAFKVTATGATSYQWYYRKSSSGTWNIVQNNGTSATYNLTTIVSHNGYQFRCLVKNSAGSVYTNTVTLKVKPGITAQPTDKTVSAGETAAFKVTATGATSYQWYYRKSSTGTWNIVQNNGTSATYNLTTIVSHNGYQFRCLVKNSAGSVYTNTVTLKVKPGITAQPTDKTVNVGETATFKVTAVGAASYQWYYRKSASGSWIAVQNNGTSSTYSLTTIASHNGYQFRCLVKNAGGSMYTNTVTLTVTNKPTITVQPTDKTVNAGETATFKVTAARATSYQWYYRKTASSGWISVKNNGTSATYNLVTIAANNGYQFRCEAKNNEGTAVSNIVTLTVK